MTQNLSSERFFKWVDSAGNIGSENVSVKGFYKWIDYIFRGGAYSGNDINLPPSGEDHTPLYDELSKILIYTGIRDNKLTEEALDILAEQFGVPGWSHVGKYNVITTVKDRKNVVLQRSIGLMRYRGTPYAINRILTTFGYTDIVIDENLTVEIFYDGSINYDGAAQYMGNYDTQFFNVTLTSDHVISTSDLSEQNAIIDLIKKYKKERVELYDLTLKDPDYPSGRIVPVYPRSTTEILTDGDMESATVDDWTPGLTGNLLPDGDMEEGAYTAGDSVSFRFHTADYTASPWTIADLSGSGCDLTQTTASAQPTFSVGQLSFDGGDSAILPRDCDLRGAGEFSVAFYFEFASIASKQQLFSVNTSYSGGSGYTRFVLEFDNADNKLYAKYRPTADGSIYTIASTAAISASTKYVVVVWFSNGDSGIRLNTVETSNSGAMTAIENIASDSLGDPTVGANFRSDANWIASGGKIYRCDFWSTKLSAADRASVYLNYISPTWYQSGNSALLTKESSAYEGSNCLRVTYNGTNDPYAYQAILENGVEYALIGAVKSDGTNIPKIYDGTTLLWTGTTSISWEDVLISSFTASASTELRFYGVGSSGYSEFDGFELIKSNTNLTKTTVDPYAGSRALRIESLNVIVDGDMEAAGVTSWPTDGTCTATKETADPHTGSQWLKLADVATGYSRARRAWTPGKKYKITGWAKGDGTIVPILTDSGGVTIWTGTNSTDWQEINLEYKAVNSNLHIGSNFPSAGHVGFDDINVTEIENLIVDGDMENSGTAAWTATASAVLSKVSVDPYSGTQNLKITWGASYSGAAQTSIVTSGKRYKITGRMRSDGTNVPVVSTYTAGATIKLGSTSTDWQEIDEEFTANASGVVLRINGGSAGYVEFDDIKVYPIDVDEQTAPSAVLNTFLDIGSLYRISGYARSDGITIPRILENSTEIWAGTISILWQPFDFIFRATSTVLTLENSVIAGRAGWDSMSLLKYGVL